MSVETFYYDNKIVRNFAFATVFWGLVGMLVGLLIAFQLPIPSLNMGEHLSFGRLRPVHTNAAIFAFVGNAIFMGVYYSLQRLCKARMFSDILSKIHFWGWQSIIVFGALTLVLGYTTSKEYAELEWPIDIAITVVWVIFGINMFGTIMARRQRHMYVAIWFYIATFLAVAVLHVFNSLALPVSFLKSYPIYAGVQDALVQWWYGHNAVAFFLTTPYLGLMYYFLPKIANRPVYSYKLSIIHFWSLVFIYIWAGPHHLLYSAVDPWAQTLGIVFSIMLIAPSWGGMLNGLLTLRGSWDKVRVNVELKFLVVAITCYGMVTLEGPLMSFKSVNSLAHFTDWIVGHVHNGTLGWNGFLTFGILYWLIPKMYQTELYSRRLANAHFWIGTMGIVFYLIAMYFAGISQGLMWKEFDGEDLMYPIFLVTVTKIIPMYYLRGIGGLIYIIGVLLMIFNLYKTVKQGNLLANEEASAPKLEVTATKNILNHRFLEGHLGLFLILTTIAVVIGGLVELVPGAVKEFVEPTTALVEKYTPLELEGRDIYIREGCNVCHSQMIRPFRDETLRYGPYSEAGDYVYDHPFLWGSKRTGPDLQRVGLRPYNEVWHYDHLVEPTSKSDGSIMPPYPWLAEKKIDLTLIETKIETMRKLGVPYDTSDVKNSVTDLKVQAQRISEKLREGKINCDWDREIIAVIAYLQSLGKRIDAKD